MDDGAVFITPSNDDVKLHGRVWSVDAPHAVLSLVHGFGEHSGRYADMAQYLNGQGIAVVAIDLRGHGRSEGKRGVTRGMDDYRHDLSCLLTKTRTLFPNVPHILYGHSMGGGIVLDYGFKPDPDIRAMITTGPLIKPADNPPALIRGFIRLVKLMAPKFTLSQAIKGDKVSTLKEEQQLYELDPLNHGKMGIGTAVGLFDMGAQIMRKAGQWKLPLLLMHAKADQLTDFAASEAFAMHAKNVNFVPILNAEHEVHNDVTRHKVYLSMANFITKWAI